MAALICAALCAAGCGGEDTEPATPTEGTAVLTFSASKGVRSNPNLVDPIAGAVYGSLYLSEDVAVTGPREGAPSFGAVDVAGVDLQMAEESTAQWKSGPVKAGLYIFLGMMDLDANAAAENREPDPGDLVTLPTTNKIEIKAGEEATLTVIFDLVYN